MDETELERLRGDMVALLRSRGIADARVLAAMASVPRHLFVPKADESSAYDDTPVPIGHGATISQPYMVAFMTEAAHLAPGDRVLEVGTGAGYQAAVLASLGCEVYSIEIDPALAAAAEARLAELGINNVRVRAGDGHKGWPEAAPFAAIIVTAAPTHVPQPLRAQLADGGRLIVPVGGAWSKQRLEIHERRRGKFTVHRGFPVRFIPMTRDAEQSLH